MPPYPAPLTLLPLPPGIPYQPSALHHQNEPRDPNPNPEPYQITLTLNRISTTITTTILLGGTATSSPNPASNPNPATTSSSSPPSISRPQGPSHGVVVGAIVGSILGFIVVMFLLWFCCIRPTSFSWMFWRMDREWDSDSYYSYEDGSVSQVSYVRRRGGSGGREVKGCLGWVSGGGRVSKRRARSVRIVTEKGERVDLKTKGGGRRGRKQRGLWGWAGGQKVEKRRRDRWYGEKARRGERVRGEGKWYVDD